MILRDKMLALMADVNAQVAEREELVELIAIALLTRKNLFILGDPGQAKSYAINAFRCRINGARQFERLLSKQTDEEQLFGRIDLSSLIPGSVSIDVLDKNPHYQEMCGKLKTRLANGQSPDDWPDKIEQYRKALAILYGGEPTVNTTGKIPEAEICFLDECFKANDGVLNSLLTALNERKYTNEGRTYHIPTISFFAASNEIPNFSDPQEKILQALYDRLELKFVTANIVEKANRQRVLKDKQAGRHGQIAATITLEELERMQEEVSAIPVPDGINDLADDVLCELRKSIRVSDRKFLGYYPIAQAKAWLEGHKTVEPSDLLALVSYFWEKPSDIPLVLTTLTRMCLDPIKDKANDIRATAGEVMEEFENAVANGVDDKKALRKFREEMLRVYGMYTDLERKTQADSEKAITNALLEDLEKDNRKTSEQVGFTYIPLAELATMK